MQIINRQEGKKSKVKTMLGFNQISFNSDNRLVFRMYDGAGESDTLIVLDEHESKQTIRFIQDNVKLSKDNNNEDIDELLF